MRGSQANSKISVGLIGSGDRGPYDASIIQADSRARVTALCDLFDDQIERAKARIKVDNPAVYKDFEKLLASSVDAVLIATPVFEHPRMLEAAVQARKQGSEIVAAFDADPAGRLLVEVVRGAVACAASRTGRTDLIFRAHLPAQEGKDWNQVLQTAQAPALRHRDRSDEGPDWRKLDLPEHQPAR